jgi:hypothetical protein
MRRAHTATLLARLEREWDAFEHLCSGGQLPADLGLGKPRLEWRPHGGRSGMYPPWPRSRPVGGLGVLLAQKLVISRYYANVFGRIHSRLRISRS